MRFEGGIVGDTAEQVDDEGMVAHSGSMRSNASYSNEGTGAHCNKMLCGAGL